MSNITAINPALVAGAMALSHRDRRIGYEESLEFMCEVYETAQRWEESQELVSNPVMGNHPS